MKKLLKNAAFMRFAACAVLIAAMFSFKTVNAQTASFDGQHFSVSYPADWKIDQENDIVNIYPANEIGAMTISGYEGVNLDDDAVKKMMLDITGLPEVPGKISVKNRNGFTEYQHEYLDSAQNIQWVTKVFKRKTDMQLVTINCEAKYWNGNYRMMFLDALKSYKPKN